MTKFKLLLGFFFILQGCAHSLPSTEISPGYTQKGIASWYGPQFHGNQTANGEIFNMHDLTAAHRTLPLGSIVQVQSLTSGKKIIVRINDRGPFIKGRIIDLSHQAAKSLSIVENGTDRVEITLLELPSGAPYREVWIQVGSFSTQSRAIEFSKQFGNQFGRIRVVPFFRNSEKWFRVQIGKFSNQREAEIVASHIKREWGIAPFLILDI